MRRATILRVLGGRRFKVSLQLAVKRLLEYDSDIVEVVQFGGLPALVRHARGARSPGVDRGVE